MKIYILTKERSWLLPSEGEIIFVDTAYDSCIDYHRQYIEREKIDYMDSFVVYECLSGTSEIKEIWRKD